MNSGPSGVLHIGKEGWTFAEPQLAAVSKIYYVQRQSNIDFDLRVCPAPASSKHSWQRRRAGIWFDQFEGPFELAV